MTGVFKLSKLAKRLALANGFALGAAALGAACATEPLATDIALPDSQPTANPAVSSITLDPDADTLLVGETTRLAAMLHDSAGAELAGFPIAWSTSDTAVASVDTSGLVRALRAGAALIAAAAGGRQGTAQMFVWADTTPGSARPGWYAATDGAGGGDGSAARPWTLATALAGGNGAVRSGDTIWVRGGTYQGPFTSTVSGAAGQPVVIRALPGERAIIDGAGTTSSTLVVRGDWSVLWGLEVINSDPVRTTDRPNTVVNDASHTRYVNLVVHDGSVGFYTYTDAADVEVYGSIFYNNGWQGTDRGHGHALYVKSDAGPVVLRDNVLFNQFGYGIHVYTNAGSGKLKNIRLERNVAFNNGTLSDNSTSANILLGGDDVADDDVVTGNLTYLSPGVSGTNVQVGYGTLANGDVTFADNYLVGGDPVLRMGRWQTATLSGNELAGTDRVVDFGSDLLASWTASGNAYRRDPLSASWELLDVSLPWLAWQTATGLGTSDVATSALPSTPAVFVLPNAYEPGRATIIVYNWNRQSTVPVDLSGVLAAGDLFEIHNVQRLFVAPLAAGTYDGVIALPMTGVSPPAPIGMGTSRAPTTGPDFEVFVVRRQ